MVTSPVALDDGPTARAVLRIPSDPALGAVLLPPVLGQISCVIGVGAEGNFLRGEVGGGGGGLSLVCRPN